MMVQQSISTSGCPATGGMPDCHPEKYEEGESHPDPQADPEHQLALAQLRLGGDFLLNKLELRLLESLHRLVNCGAGSLLIDGNHCHHISFARVKIF